jgi:hypothetical protein
MEEFEDLVTRLEAVGYYPQTRRSGKPGERQWEVLLSCSGEKLPAYLPRPEAKAPKLLEALQLVAKKVRV